MRLLPRETRPIFHFPALTFFSRRPEADTLRKNSPHALTPQLLACLLAGLSILAMAACGGGWQGSTPLAPTIVLQPAAQTVAAGQTATFTVTASGTAPFTYQWYSGNAPIPGANASTYTTATALTDNGATFTVVVTNAVGAATSITVTLTVTAAALRSISVGPAISSIPKGTTQPYTATGSYTDGSTQDLTTTVAWTSSFPSVATIGSGTGLALGLDLGTTQITASQGGITSSPVRLSVLVAALQSVAIAPSSPSIPKGTTQQFSATAIYTDGTTLDVTHGVTWASATPATATIGASSGFATSVAVGTTQITATLDTMLSSPVTLTVTAAALRTIAVTPSSPTIVSGETQQFTAIGTFSDSSTLDLTSSATWTSANPSVATINSSTGLATGVGAGTSAITATEDNVTSSSVWLTVNNTSPVATSLVCSSTTPPYNSSIQLTPTFSGGAGVIGSSGTGSSDITATALSGGSYPTPLLTAAKTYTLTVTGSGGDTATAACSATPTAVSILSISPNNQTMAPGTQSFTASVSGGAINTVTWSATGGTFNNNLWTSSNLAGTYTITATSVDKPSLSLSTTMTISAPVFTTQPVSQDLCAGASAVLSVAADYEESYQWNLNGTPIPGATSSLYSVPSAASGDAGNYTATATNPAGSVNSNIARVLVGSSIISNPQSLSIFPTQTATFSVSAGGQSPFTYQWYVLPSGSSNPVLLSGATSSTYTTPAVDISYTGNRYYAAVTDRCGGSPLTSSNATLTVNIGNVPPTITTEPTGQDVAVGATPTFTVIASGTPTLSYQWYWVPAGASTGSVIPGANSSSYTVPSSDATTANDQDTYYVIVSNSHGQAVSERATLAVGDGVLIQISDQPKTVYVNEGEPATFSVTATSLQPLSYQWYRANPGSSTFVAIPGATGATYTLDPTAASDTGAVFHVVVNNGVTSSVTSASAALFVGDLSGINDLCDTNWTARGNAFAVSGCKFQLTAATQGQHGEIVWPVLISTGNIYLSFTVAISSPSSPPADGFAVVLGDPSLGATPTSTGDVGLGLGAEGIPGFVLGFDTYHNTGDPAVPYLGVGRGETALWENPWSNVNTNIPALATQNVTVSHDYIVAIVQGKMTVTMDGNQVFSGNVTVPPVAYVYVTASTGGFWEKTVISNVAATVSAPSN